MANWSQTLSPDPALLVVGLVSGVVMTYVEPYQQNQIGDGQYEVILASTVIRRSKHGQAGISGRAPLILILPWIYHSSVSIRWPTKTLWSACVKGNIKALSLNLIFAILVLPSTLSLLSQYLNCCHNSQKCHLFLYAAEDLIALVSHWLSIVCICVSCEWLICSMIGLGSGRTLWPGR